MENRYCFSSSQLKAVRAAGAKAAAYVSDYYRVSPREWRRMPYEVKTLRALDLTEVTDAALAQTICYEFKRKAGPVVINEGDLYRICLQDHRILVAAESRGLPLGALLTYVLTHELVHVVRFGQQLQRIDLPYEFRHDEEAQVERTTRQILTVAHDPQLRRLISQTAPACLQAHVPA